MGRGRKPKAVNEDAMKAAYINGDSIFSITRAFGVDSRRVKVILGIEPKHRAQTEKLSPLPPKARPQKDEPEPVDWEITLTLTAEQLDYRLNGATAEELMAAVLEMDPQAKASALAIIMQYRIDHEEAQSDG